LNRIHDALHLLGKFLDEGRTTTARRLRSRVQFYGRMPALIA